jgi:hypothetical protein
MGIFGNFFKPDLDKLNKKGDVQAIIDLALNENQEVSYRKQALGLLMRYENKEIIDVLLSALKNQNNEIRYAAADSLRYKAIKGNSRAIQGLFDVVLKDPDESIRRQAREAFITMLSTDMTNSDALRGLTILLKDPHYSNREEAVYALLRLKGTSMEKIFEDREFENLIKSAVTMDYNYGNLASDRNLTCSMCGKRPLLKKADVSNFSSQQLMDLTVGDRAGRCTRCGRIVCTGCVQHLDKRLPDGYKGCPFCISKMEII